MIGVQGLLTAAFQKSPYIISIISYQLALNFSCLNTKPLAKFNAKKLIKNRLRSPVYSTLLISVLLDHLFYMRVEVFESNNRILQIQQMSQYCL